MGADWARQPNIPDDESGRSISTQWINDLRKRNRRSSLVHFFLDKLADTAIALRMDIRPAWVVVHPNGGSPHLY
jgi:hypothetical protein